MIQKEETIVQFVYKEYIFYKYKSEHFIASVVPTVTTTTLSYCTYLTTMTDSTMKLHLL